MAHVTPLERRVLMDVYNMTDANIEALDPGIAEHLITKHRGGLVYDIVRDDPDKPELATTLGELRAQDFVDSASQMGKLGYEGIAKTAKFIASLPGRALDAATEPLGKVTTSIGIVLGLALVFWVYTRK